MKKILALLLTVGMVLGLFAGCGNSNTTPAGTAAAANPTAANPTAAAAADSLDGTYDITVWVSEMAGVKELTEQQIKDFMEENPGIVINATIEGVTELDSATQMITSVEDGADLFCFAQDQLARLVQAGALTKLGTKAAAEVTELNDSGAVAAATIGSDMWCYPMTSDNGYFLYYDKSVFTEDDLKTLDGILAAANAAGKKVHMDVSNGWYLASFFLGNGCTLTIEDGKQVIDFNNANGLAAAEAIRAFCNDPAFVTGDDSVLAGGIGDAIACGVSGTWVASAIQEKLGDNYGCCKLPTFTCDGKQVQMGSFLGCKIYGVNSQTAYPVDSMELAEYLTSEKAQIERYNVLNYGPSNVNALADDTIASNLALQALNAQSEFAVSQMVLGGFWTPAEAFGAELEAHSTGDLQAMLDQLVEQALAG